MNELLHHFREQRPWGNFEQFTLNEVSTVKIITVQIGQAFSLQTHTSRSEFWKIIGGEGYITHGDVRELVEVGKLYALPQGTLHRMESTTSPIVFLEVALGHFDESDIERLEDKYGRH
jgi:mannose-1-phosphate guanylyltransferase/mannose-1-phosphate guanylyltransferase/mannose-6-phosphate isomerase